MKGKQPQLLMEGVDRVPYELYSDNYLVLYGEGLRLAGNCPFCFEGTRNRERWCTAVKTGKLSKNRYVYRFSEQDWKEIEAYFAAEERFFSKS
jgi:hypothetical protein